MPSPNDTLDIDQNTPPEPMPPQQGNIMEPPSEAPHPPTEDVEVDFNQSDVNLETETTPEQEAEKHQEDVLDVLVPKKEPRTWKIGQGQLQREYVQRPLSFIAKMQWFSLVGGVLDKAMSGDNALTVGNLMSMPGRGDSALRMEDFRDADTFIQAVGKIVFYAPDFLTKSYCIWLSVPDYEHEMVAEMMSRPPDEGGLTDDDGFEIIEVFIDQNYEALEHFFRERLGQLQNRVRTRAQEAGDRRQ